MSATMAAQVDVVVVGADLAGLVAPCQLRAAGRSVAVLEAKDRVGGRTYNGHTSDGTVLELGGEWIGQGQDRMAALAAELGVETFPTWRRRRSGPATWKAPPAPASESPPRR